MAAEKISVGGNSELRVPNEPIIPFIEGDGTGPDIWKASRRVFDAAVEKAYGGKKKIQWKEVLAGEKAHKATGEWLPQATLDAIKEHIIAIKGPLTTPVGGGIRSLNVTLRQELNLFACVRPVRWFKGVGCPVNNPQDVNMVIFRENIEDVYAGIEFASGTPEAKKLIDFLAKELGKKSILPSAGIGIKPMSPERSKQLVRKAIKYAIAQKQPSITLVHKGNIMKFTEGAFKDWGYQVAKDEFADFIITEQDVTDQFAGKAPKGKIIIKDRIADAMFQQVLLRPSEYSVVATPNLNGDYISDALIAQVGGLGLGPGANFSDAYAIFEATHGTAPKYAGQDKVNPGSVILSGEMMFRYLGWNEVADKIIKGLEGAIHAKRVTYDLERQMEGATTVKCSEFGNEIIKHM